MWGRIIGDKLVLPLSLLGVAATVLAALPLYIAGFVGQVGGIPANDAQVDAILSLDGVEGGSIWMLLSLVGHGLMALTVLAFVGLMFKTFNGNDDDDDRDAPTVGTRSSGRRRRGHRTPTTNTSRPSRRRHPSST
jgi:cytochrome o ubiquinol oxidase subunit 1